MGIRFIQGRPSLITEDADTRNLYVHSEDMALGKVVEHEYDMVMLNQAACPSRTWTRSVRCSTSPRARAAGSWNTIPSCARWTRPTDGIFLAGACQGLKDIPAHVASGFGGGLARSGASCIPTNGRSSPAVALVWEDRCISAQGKKCGMCARGLPVRRHRLSKWARLRT